MKIIITGGGVAGLATYLHLTKHLPPPPAPLPSHSIIIYESHRPKPPTSPDENQNEVPPSFESLSTSTAIVGGGLGIAPNGMRVLAHLDAGLRDAVAAQGFPCENFVFMAARNGWTLGVQGTGDGGGFEGAEGRAEVCVSSSRHGLWACLREKVPEGVVRYGRVVGAERRGGKVVVRLEGSGEDECDLLVGADGVRSKVREALFGEAKVFAPVYTWVFAFVHKYIWVGPGRC